MGHNGITFPFLIGSLALKAGKPATIQQAKHVLDEIVRLPVEGYFVEINWCSTILAPFLNTKRIDDPYQMNPAAIISRPSGTGDSIVFGLNLTFQMGTKNGPALLERLLKDATEPIGKGCYSRTQNKGTLDFEYGYFSPKELQYIQETIMVLEK